MQSRRRLHYCIDSLNLSNSDCVEIGNIHMHNVVNINIADQIQVRALVVPGYHMQPGVFHLGLWLANCIDAQSTILDHVVTQHTICLQRTGNWFMRDLSRKYWFSECTRCKNLKLLEAWRCTIIAVLSILMQFGYR